MPRPSFQFYPADWRANAKLRRCTDAERGVWIDVMCLLHDSEEYGILRWPLKELAQAAGCSVGKLENLRTKGVLKGADTGVKCDPLIYVPRHAGKDGEPVTIIAEQVGPIWYSSRMVRDEHVRTKTGASTRFTKASAPTSPASGAKGTDRARLRAKVFEKTAGICVYCKSPLGDVWEIDHFVPRSKGGSNLFNNLMPSCVKCNQDKLDTMPDDWSPPSQREGYGSSSSSSSSSSEDQTHKPIVGQTPPDVAPGESDRRKATEVAKRLIAYLNGKAGTAFKEGDANLKFPIARILNDHATEDELKAVVDLKVAECAKGEFDQKYLRPATLWNAEKFAQYVGQLRLGGVSVVRKDAPKPKFLRIFRVTPEGVKKEVKFYEMPAETTLRDIKFDAAAVRAKAKYPQFIFPENCQTLIVDFEGEKRTYSLPEIDELAKKASHGG